MLIELNFIKIGEKDIKTNEVEDIIKKEIEKLPIKVNLISLVSMSNWFLVLVDYPIDRLSRDVEKVIDILAGSIVVALDCSIRYRHYEVHGMTGSLIYHTDWRKLLALHTIAKDEGLYVKDWLNNYKYLFNDIVIAVNNTSDNTYDEVAAGGGRWLPYTWKDNYADAYNFAKDNTDCEWVFKLDIDEDMTPDLAKNLRNLCMNPQYDAVEFNVYNEVWKDTVRQIRLFRRNLGFWEGPIHPALRGVIDDKILKSDYTIIHHQRWIATGGKVAEKRQAFYDYLVNKYQNK